MAIEIVELHHPGYRIDEKLLDTTVDFYANVLGLERDKSRPTIPGIPGAWINVGEVGQLHLIGGRQPSPVAKGPGEDPTRPHVALAVADILATKKELDRMGAHQSRRAAGLHERSLRQHGGAASDRQMQLSREQSDKGLD